MIQSDIAFISAFLAGLVSFFSPCVFPLLPLYLSVIVPNKSSAGKLQVISSACFFILGFTLIFVLLGLTASSVGEFFMQYQDVLRKIGGLFMAVMGLVQLGVLKLNFLMRQWQPLLSSHSGRKTSAFFLGMAFVFGWVPCTGPVLASILMYAGIKQSAAYGAYLLISYSIGFSLPLLIVALTTDKMANSLKGVLMPYLEALQKLSGLILITIGILLYFDFLTLIITKLS